jgi:hypothetical protein
MSFYVRQITSGDVPTIEHIALSVMKSGAEIVFGEADADGISTIFSGDVAIAELEVNPKGSELFDEEVAEFRDRLDGVSGNVEPVTEAFENATCIVAIQVFFEGRSPEEVMNDLRPLMTWLQDHCPGLTQADGDGFYDKETLILETPN